MSVSLLIVSYKRPKLLAETMRTAVDIVDELIIIEDIRPHKPDEFINPAPLWNHALDMSSGDVLIIQNSECRHVNDYNYVVSSLAKVPKGEAWFASCESLNQDGSFHMWYTHPEYRKVPYFFCGSINREDMVRWDEDFVNEGYEDVALAESLKSKGIKFRWLYPEEAHVQHQWHVKDIASSSPDTFFNKYGYFPPND